MNTDEFLRGACFDCGAPNGVLYTHDSGAQYHLCKACSAQQALWEAAQAQLQALVLPPFIAWHETWGHVAGLSTGSEALSVLEARLSTLEDDFSRNKRRRP